MIRPIIPIMTTLFQVKRLMWRVQRPVSIGVRIAPIRADGCVLMVRHTYLSGWFLPGGGADRGETLAHAAVRELSEEAGLTAAHEPVLVALETVFKDGKTDHVALYRVPIVGEPTVDGFEICEARYFPLSDPPGDISPLTRRHLSLVRREQQTPPPQGHGQP
ncbi:MAG: 8-oxo-dGTP pyrophosphatase MutT (NUDIX family) [Myxococcota bacterium]|jgi:8-oxo-dGTP pyrophosphatase MutT (NUDIX family)